MPREKRITKAGFVYHVMNRANGRLRIFKKSLDFIAFENTLAEGIERTGIRLCGYCILPNHWRMLLWPSKDDTMLDFLRWTTLTHTQRWHAAHGTTGMGHIYQSRYKSFPVQSDAHYYLKVMRHIESNPFRDGLVENLSDWQWSSFAHRNPNKSNVIPTEAEGPRLLHPDDNTTQENRQPQSHYAKPFKLSPGPVNLPENWPEIVKQPVGKNDYARLTNCIKKGCPYGDKEWVAKTANELNLQSKLRKPGRPQRYK